MTRPKPAATVLTTATLLNKLRAPGDTLTQAQLNKLDKNLVQTLLNQRVIALGDVDRAISAEEKEAETEVRRAIKKLEQVKTPKAKQQARAQLNEAEQVRRMAEYQRIASERVELAANIDAALQAIANDAQRYRTLGMQLKRLLGNTSRQITDNWRLEAAVKQVLLGHARPKIDTLAEAEQQVLDNELKKAMKHA